MTRGIKPQNEYRNDQIVGEKHRMLTFRSCWTSMQNTVKIIMFSQQRFNAWSPQGEYKNEVQATVFTKRKESSKQNTAATCSQPWTTSLHRSTAWQTTGGPKGKVVFSQQLDLQIKAFCPVCLQDSSPNLGDFVLGDTQASESYQETWKHLPSWEWWRMGSKGAQWRKEGVRYFKNLVKLCGKDFPKKHWLSIKTPEWSLMFTFKSITNFGRYKSI